MIIKRVQEISQKGRSLIIIVIIAVLFLMALSSCALAIEPFKVTQYVTDQAQILSESERAQLSDQLGQYAEKTGNQFLVITVPSLENGDLVDFTEKLFALNKPGQKGVDNGLILFIAINERKIRFEVGYGLEEKLPDGKAGAIIREDIAPYFKAGDYYSGIMAGVNSAISAMTPGYQMSSAEPRQAPKKDSAFPAAFLVAIIIFVISLFGGRGSHRRRYGRGYSEPWYWGGGGGFGGSGGGGFGGGSSGGFSGGGGSFGGGGASGGW